MSRNYRTILVCCVLLALCLAMQAQAGGPLGICGTGSASIANLQELHVGWVRVDTVLSATGQTSWNSAAFAYYDGQIANYVNAGIQVILLINHGTYKPTSLASWNVNAVETGGTDGSNSTINDFAQNYAVPVIGHYEARGVKVFEIWNEPNMSSWYIQPSCYANILTEVYCRARYAGYYPYSWPGIVLTAGSMYGWGNEWSAYNSANAGADYLSSVYSKGNSTGKFTYCRNTWGHNPFDAIGQHIYLNTVDPDAFSATNFQNYIDYVHNVAVANGDGGMKTYLTEWGFEDSCLQGDGTNRCNLTNQGSDFNAAFGAIIAKSGIVRAATYYRWNDVGDGESFGIVSGSLAHKNPIWGNFQTRAEYVAKTSATSGQDSYVLNYYNNHGGQASLGNPRDNGGSAYLHRWTGGSFWADVQDFQGGAYWNATIFKTGWSGNPTWQVNDQHSFWATYMLQGGMGYFGCPNNDEYAYGSGTRQDFQVHYMTWDPTNGTVVH